jgi:cobalt/nickel transport system permease protein
MAAGHSHPLYLERPSPLHRVRPQCKLLAAFLFVLAVVATPREAFWAYALDALVLVAAAAAGRLPARFVLRRLTVEAPFVLFALALPFVGRGERVHVLGLALSSEGLWAMANILIKATLGVTATIVLAATTPLAELLRGLERLRVPSAFTTIAAFMVRYTDTIADEVRRMRVARLSRGYDPRWLWQARAVAASAGTLFIRSYERGERVYLAMLSRGWTGAMPVTAPAAAPAQWVATMTAPLVAALAALAAWTVQR